MKRGVSSWLSRCLLLAIFAQGASFADAGSGEAPDIPSEMQLFLLVGQSNMAGRGKVTPEDRIPDPQIFVLDKNDDWVNEGEPIHFDKSFAGVGLGFTFAKQVAEENPKTSVGLIPCAVGGTPIRRWMPGQDLFEEAVRRTKIAMERGELKAILWHQGESECGSASAAKAYGQNLAVVANAFREALDAPDVPFIAGELGPFIYPDDPVRSANASLINEGIRSIPERIEEAGVVSSEGLSDRGDQLHFDADSQKEFGGRYFATYKDIIETE
ncbi:sialate O-acetylesterase [Puniceicoccus vermicola]|uniref:Sialate O-acetylesterase n=1 Tax=Puniceicoccus vermicola TaxID=388746 RepID=A0A7X1B4S9_9BACT|nr:sialate O-acetylesterase [Puniceicoccus vermicola]MBC2604380.1 sialate O-acetylesterase [Puniceicoccus vermicola]